MKRGEPNTAGVQQQHQGTVNIAPHKFRPGVSGNPNGRPRGSRNLTTAVRQILETEADFKRLPVKDAAKLEKLYRGATVGELIAYVQATKAINGDTKAAEFLARNGGNPSLLDPVSSLSPLLADAVARQAAAFESGQQLIESGAIDD